MRLVLKFGLAPDRQPLPSVQASEDESGAVGRWFSANFDVKTVLAVFGVLTTLIGYYVTDQTTHTRMQADLTSLREETKRGDVKDAQLERRFQSVVVSRQEYQNTLEQMSQRLSTQQTEIQQLYQVLLHAERLQ